MGRIESRLAKLERQTHATTGGITIVVVEDTEWYGNNAHRLAREAEPMDENHERTTSKPADKT